MRGLGIFVVMFASAACSSGPVIRVTVDDIPANASALVVGSTLAGHAGQPERFDLPNTNTQTFALQLPAKHLGWFSLGISAADKDGCDLAWEAPGIDLTSLTATVDLRVSLRPVDPPTCDLARTPGMMYVPASTFTIGCELALDPNCVSDEQPPKDVPLGAFEIDRTEVTVADYADCLRAGPCSVPLFNADLPGDSARNWVDWAAANAFCTSRSKTLPTEAQWEAAARGTDGRLYPWGDEPAPTCDLANFSPGPNEYCRTYGALDSGRVGLLPKGASPYGVLDLAGNVEEWTNDWYKPRDAMSDDEYVSGPATGSDRVVKGGSLLYFAPGMRGAWRVAAIPDGSSGDAAVDLAHNTLYRGFRCARSP